MKDSAQLRRFNAILTLRFKTSYTYPWVIFLRQDWFIIYWFIAYNSFGVNPEVLLLSL